MKKEYGIALSYARKDSEIEKIMEKELEQVFTGGVFTDMLRKEKLANTSQLKEKLQSIFQEAEYSIILYSKNYYKGKFTRVEMEAINNCAEPGKEPHSFIVKIDGSKKIPKEWRGRTYIKLRMPNSFKKGKAFARRKYAEDLDNLTRQIRDIIHNRIKKFMIEQKIQESRDKREFSLNIHTTFGPGNGANWRMDYDWNLLGTGYIEENGRKIKQGTTWQDFWPYLEKDFIWIREELRKGSDACFKICLNCQLSVAYKLGHAYGDLSQGSGNRNLVLTSSNRVSEIEFPLAKEIRYTLPEDFCRVYEGNDTDSTNIACIISIKFRKNERIVETVKEFFDREKMSYSKIYLFQKEAIIERADDLENLAEYMRETMENCRKGNKDNKGVIHLFPDTMAPLMFVLGARTIIPGKICLYEYDPDQDTYEMSLTK